MSNHPDFQGRAPSAWAHRESTSAPAALDSDEERLLRSYTNGPRIWDAASVFEVVVRLAEKGMVVPHGDRGAYEITDAGRAALAGPVALHR